MRTKWRNAAKVATGAVACRAGPPPLFRRFGRGRPMRLGIVALAIGEQVAREEAAETLFDAVGEAEARRDDQQRQRSEEHTSELQSLMRLSYAVFCLKKQNIITTLTNAEQFNT